MSPSENLYNSLLMNNKKSFKVRERFLPYALPLIGEEEITEVVDSLRSGWITTGPKTKKFEALCSTYLKSNNAIAVNSCTAGLHIALKALGVGPGDEVILPTLTFCATANVVVHLGATPVFIDVGEDFNILPEEIESHISSKTKAIIPVHYGGQACDLEAIYKLGQKYSIPIVEDAAHAIGSTYKGLKIGCDQLSPPGIKRITVFSFYATKNMTTGEGGLISTPDDGLAERIRILSLHGMSRDAWKRYTSAGSWYYEVVEAGYKYNMTDIQASIGIHQLAKLDSFINKRQELANIYNKGLSQLPNITIPVRKTNRNHIYHLYVIRLNRGKFSINRSEFIEKLKEFNIGTSVHFIPVHLHPFYKQTFGYKAGNLQNAESLYDQIISLPLYPLMEEEDANYVISVIDNLYKKYQ